ncbi:MAG: hypothetical protein LBL66_04335, partial [Clostridiales bacterium]|nr:hypothetical protein [Clostridiales bacterium]
AEEKIAELQTAKDNQDAADPVIAAIGNLPAVGALTLENKTAVESARTAYDGLTEMRKALVANYETLTAAEAKIAELQAANGNDTDPDKKGCGNAAAALAAVLGLAAVLLLKKKSI